jgi:hypothetical protein
MMTSTVSAGSTLMHESSKPTDQTSQWREGAITFFWPRISSEMYFITRKKEQVNLQLADIGQR